MTVSDADLAKLRADLALASDKLATVTGQVRLLASQQNDLAFQLASGVVVRRRLLPATPVLQQGYGVVAVNGGVQVADAAGLALTPLPSGIAIAGAQPDEYVYIATSGVRPNSETLLGGGIATAVGQNASGKLVRANDPTCLPGFYYGDCNTAGDLTIHIRSTSVTSDAMNLAWTQPAFYFDDAGSNSNVGDSPSSPIVTNAEYLKRTGFTRDAPQNTTLYYSSDRPITDPLRQTLCSSQAGAIRVFGRNLTVLRTGTVGTYAADDYSVPEAARLTDANTALSWPLAMGRMTSGPHAGNTGPDDSCNAFYVAQDQGSGRARIQSPTYHNASDYFNTYEFAPSPGETYEIVSPRKVPIHVSGFGQINRLRPSWDIYFIETTGGFVNSPFENSYTLEASNVFHQWTFCKLPVFAFTISTYGMMSCCIGGGSGALGGAMVGNALVTMYHTLFLNVRLAPFSGKINMGGKTLFQGCGAWDFTLGGEIHAHGGSGCHMIFDSVSTLATLASGRWEVKGKLFGKNNVGMLASITGDGKFVDTFLFNQNFRCAANGEGAYGVGQYDFSINGSTSGFAINPATGLYDAVAIDYTWPKLQAAYGAGGTGGFGGTIKHPVHAGMVLKGY